MAKAEIAKLVRQLHQIETSTPRHPAVLEMLEIMHTILEPHKYAFIQNDVLISYHGSLQYHDPRNLDVDLVFTTQDKRMHDRIYKQHTLPIEDQFSKLQYWPKMGQNMSECVTNFGSFSIEELTQDAHDLMESRSSYDEEDCTDLHISYILSSKIFYSEQMGLLRKYKAEVTKILEISPVLSQAVVECLRDTVITRQKRRM